MVAVVWVSQGSADSEVSDIKGINCHLRVKVEGQGRWQTGSTVAHAILDNSNHQNPGH